MPGWLVLMKMAIAQHVQQGGLSSIIEAQEKNFCILVLQTKITQQIEEPVPEPRHELLAEQRMH
jgi:hypothetical protein